MQRKNGKDLKNIAPRLFVYLILFTVLVSSASATAVFKSVNIRGPVYNGTNLESILANSGDNIG